MPDPKWKANAHSKLENFVNDITTLEVVTLSGNITVKDLKLTGAGGINFQKVLESIKGKATDSSAISVVAATKIDLDKDIQQFVKSGMTPEDKELFHMHLQAMQQAQVARKATFEMLINIVKS
ncbi:MAG TPA: hypothetical protein ENJ95_02120 [Bacteroidetes bacterium]|nr:hypothetical protein [Bacteroidota bacterium]